jgi:tRNA A-37 threonylcarbamoyl transferase component Bud32
MSASTTWPPPPPLPAPLLPLYPHVPGFEILDELGRGGMGMVYRARQTDLNRIVAVKTILAGRYASPDDLVQLRKEAEAIAQMQHANIVQIHEIAEHSGLVYVVLEYCPRGSLAAQLRRQALAPRRSAELVKALARAMEAVHGKELIHLDLKPANVLLADDGTPKIADFGLARKLAELQGAVDQVVRGTLPYMSLEQLEGRLHQFGPRCDVYALGAILYECLTGQPPFRAASYADMLRKVRDSEPLSPRRLRPGTPRDLEIICLRCLQKQPHLRYATARALADDLARFLRGEPILAGNWWERTWRWCRRRLALDFLRAAVLLLLGMTAARHGGAWLSAGQHGSSIAVADATVQPEITAGGLLGSKAAGLESDKVAVDNLVATQLAAVYLDENRVAEAQQILEQRLAISQQQHPNHWTVYIVQQQLGRVLLAQKKYDQAEAHLLAAHLGFQNRAGAMQPSLRENQLVATRRKLAELYEEWGRCEEAAHWRALLERRDGPPLVERR